jgi:hypothetical protein
MSQLRRKHHPTPLALILKGVLAGAVGTAAMTAHQELRQRLAQQDEPDQGNAGSADEQGDPCLTLRGLIQRPSKVVDNSFSELKFDLRGGHTRRGADHHVRVRGAAPDF